MRETIQPTVYLVGRDNKEAARIKIEFRIINPSSQAVFVQCDITLLKNVDLACAEIQSKERQINLLFMSTGYLTMSGRRGMSHVIDSEAF